jgi:hypothetical protein
MLVSRSADGGMTWSAPQALIVNRNFHVFNDKPSITADPHDDSLVYATWTRFVFPSERVPPQGVSDFYTSASRGPTYFTRTTDGGASWERARSIFDPGQNDGTISNQISVTGEGDLVNVMAVSRNDNSVGRMGATISVLRSADHGATWSGEIPIDRLGTVFVRDPRDGALVRTGEHNPSIATDERPGHDEVYVVWQDARWTGFERDQIAFSKSLDGGRTWSGAVRINAVASTQAFTPAIEVDDSGNIAVTHYDFRNDTTASQSLDTDVWILRSADGGATWSEERVTTAPFDMRQAPNSRGFFVGDYIGTAAVGHTFVVFYSISTPSGTNTFAATVTAPFPPATITPEPAP